MSPALWGLLAAVSFGTGDFLGRFSGRALGPRQAALGLMLSGSVLLSAYAAFGDMPPLSLNSTALLPALAAGAAASLGPLCFYKGLTLGPLSLVGPVAGAYPAFVVPVSLFSGARPSAGGWLAMAATMAGVLIVARNAGADPDRRVAADPANRRRAILAALGAALMFAAAVVVGRQATAQLGAAPALWVGRLVGCALMLGVLGLAGERPRLPRRWWPLLAVQGTLDAAGYWCVYQGGQGQGAWAAAVASSAFMVVAVLLGRLVLKETVTMTCWLGVALVFGGVALLSAAAP